MPLAKIILVIVSIVIYISLSHIALIAPDPHNIWRQVAMFLLMAPIIGVLTWGTSAFLNKIKIHSSFKHACVAFVAGLMICGSLLLWQNMLSRLDWIYLAQHTASNLLLGWFFGRTLFNQRVPIITTLAQAVHGVLPEQIIRYTRGVTIAWTIFFAAQVIISVFIFYFLSIETWSLFANVLNWPQVILMFIAEYTCRKIINPDFQHATVKESISAYFNEKNKV